MERCHKHRCLPYVASVAPERPRTLTAQPRPASVSAPSRRSAMRRIETGPASVHRPMRARRAVAILAALAAGAAIGGWARADDAGAASSPPRSAVIVEGRSMAGVALASKAPKSAMGDRILAGPLAGWGPVDGSGFCFEGSNCEWDVSGGQTVLVVLNPTTERVQTI